MPLCDWYISSATLRKLSRECNANMLATTCRVISYPSAESLSRPVWLRASNLISHMRSQSTSHLHARTYIWPACTYIRWYLMYEARGAKRLCVSRTLDSHARSASKQPITCSWQPFFASSVSRLQHREPAGRRIAPTLKPTHRGEG